MLLVMAQPVEGAGAKANHLQGKNTHITYINILEPKDITVTGSALSRSVMSDSFQPRPPDEKNGLI